MSLILFVVALAVGCTPTVDDPAAHDTFVLPLPDTGETGETGGGDDIPDGLGVRLHEEISSIAYVSWEQDAPGTARVEVSFDEGEWESTPERSYEAGTNEQIVLGIPYDTDFSFRVVTDTGAGPLTSGEGHFRTGELPEEILVPTVMASQSDLWEPTGRYLLGSINLNPGGWVGGVYWKWIIDRKGRVVWALVTPDNHWSIYLRTSYDGNDILYDEATYWAEWDEGAGSTVHRIKIDGSEVAAYATPGLHHAFTELADETLVWGAATWTTERLVQMPPGGEVETIWDCEAFHLSLGVTTHCQSNTLYWDEPSDRFLYSFYTTNSVVEIDHATGDTTRIWGALPGAWTFDPPDSQFYWQHGVNYTSDGTLLLSTYRTESGGGDLVAREYDLDPEGEALHEVWSFGVDEGIFGDVAGEAHRLPGGNTLHNYGSGARVREVTPDGQVVWDLAWEDKRLVGRTVLLEDLYAFAPDDQ